MLYFILAIIILMIILVMANIKVVPQANAYVIERFGAYAATWNVGLHVKIPIMDRVANKVLLKEQVIDFKPQPVITKDNVTMQIDTVTYLNYLHTELVTHLQLLKILRQQHCVILLGNWN